MSEQRSLQERFHLLSILAPVAHVLNKFLASCFLCECVVPKGEGFVEKHRGIWYALCSECYHKLRPNSREVPPGYKREESQEDFLRRMGDKNQDREKALREHCKLQEENKKEIERRRENAIQKHKDRVRADQRAQRNLAEHYLNVESRQQGREIGVPRKEKSGVSGRGISVS